MHACKQSPGLLHGQVVPILRAGLALLDAAATVLPGAATYHVGYVRDEATLEVRPARCGIVRRPAVPSSLPCPALDRLPRAMPRSSITLRAGDQNQAHLQLEMWWKIPGQQLECRFVGLLARLC